MLKFYPETDHCLLVYAHRPLRDMRRNCLHTVVRELSIKQSKKTKLNDFMNAISCEDQRDLSGDASRC